MSAKFRSSLFPLLVFALFPAFLTGCSREGKVEGHLAEALQHFENRDYEKAKIEYMNVLQVDRTNAVAFQHLAKILFAQGQPVQAFPLLVRSSQAFPADVEIREDLAVLYGHMPGDTNRTHFFTEVGALLDLSPTNETGILLLADTARSPADVADLERRLSGLRARVGDRAIYHVADAALAQKRGDTNACEAHFQKAIQLEPGLSAARVGYGNLLAFQGRHDEAAVQLKEAKDGTPPYSPAWERWARFLLERGRTEEAKAVLDEINTKAPERVSAWNVRGQIAMSERKLDEAEKMFNRSLSIAPSNPDSLRALGQLRLAQNKPAEALRNLEKVADLVPRSAQVHYQLALAHLVNKDTTRASGSLETAVQLDPQLVPAILLLADLNIARGKAADAVLTLRNLVQQQPQMEQARLGLIRAQRAANHIPDALASAQAGRKDFPSSGAIALQLGLILKTQNQSTQAREALEAAMQLSTNSLPALEQLVALDVGAKDFPGALARIQKGLDREPGQPLLWLMKAEVHLAQKDHAAAETALRKVLELDPTSENAFLSLARVYVRSGRQQEALAEIDQVLKRDPENLRALVMVGMLETDRGNYARAREAYETALRKKPTSTLILNNLAFVVAEHLHQPEEARSIAQKARDLAPDDAVIADTLGWIDFRRGRYEDALRLLTDASTRLPANAEVRFHLGMTYYMLDQEEPARRTLQEAVDSTGEFPSRSIAIEHLALLDIPPGTSASQLIPKLEERRKAVPGDIVALSRLADAYEATGAYAKSRETLEAAIAANPRSAAHQVRLATLLAGPLKDPAKGLELAQAARNLAPEDPEIAYVVGRLMFRAGNRAGALPLLEQSARHFANRADVLADFARAAYSQGRIDDAVRAMTRAGSAPGASATLTEAANSFLALALIARDPSTAGAAAKVAEARQANPEDPIVLHAAAALAESQGNYAEARDGYEKLLKQGSDFGPAVRQLAILYGDQFGDDTRAFELGMKARRLNPNHDALAAALGKVICRRGDFPYAVELLSEAARTRTNDAGLYYHLGLAYLGSHKTTEGRTALQKALALHPSPAIAADIGKRLKEPGSL